MNGHNSVSGTPLANAIASFWWLDYYEGLHERLDAAYRVIRNDEHVLVYDLAAGRS